MFPHPDLPVIQFLNSAAVFLVAFYAVFIIANLILHVIGLFQRPCQKTKARGARREDQGQEAKDSR
jgi:hypothetical protein